MVTIHDIAEARKRLAAYIRPSPLIHSNYFSQLFGKEIFLKLENLQDTGSFKVRGALNHILCLPKKTREKGVVAASAGNHAQGVAWAAKQLSIPATIFMPRFASVAKLLATQSYGADVIQTGETYDEAAEAAKQWVAGNDGNLIPAFNDPRVIAGQGTIGLEILEQIPEANSVIVPAGGGGLLAGIAISLKSSRPDIEIFGAQAEHSQGLVESLKRGAPTTSPPIATIADGIAVATPGQLTFQIIQQHVDHVAAVGESAIESAVITFLERKHIVVEGAGAVPLALLIEGKIRMKAQQLVLVVSGGNLDLQLMDRIIQRGSLRLGRRMRLRIVIPDRPGSLHQITGTIAAQGANILQVYHYRMVPDQPLNVSRVDFEVEVRGHHHAEEIIRKLEVEGVHVLR